MCSYKAKLCDLLCSYISITLTIAFALLEQATVTTTITTIANTDTTTTTIGVTATGSIDDKPVTVPRNTTSSDVSQKRDSAEHLSPDPLTKDVHSTVTSKPEPPKLSKLKPITSTQNKETDCLVSPDSTGYASGNKDIMNTCQNVPKENFPALHISPASVQFTMHSEESTNVVGNFQSNTQQLATDTVRYKILEGEPFGETVQIKNWQIIY